MVVSGGAVSPENRSNETEIREIAECYLYDGDSDRPLNAGYYALNDVAGLVAAVEQERDAYKRSATAAWEAHEGVSEMYTEAESELDAALARIAAVEAEPAISELAAQQSKMISGSYPADLSDEAHMWRRCAKAGEEHGEVIEALLGFVGENPRKGVTADREKVIKELLDEAFAALGAVEYLRGNDGSSGRLLAEHALFVTGRLRAVLAASPTPTGPTEETP